MDDRGNIRQFATKEEAIAAGFPHDVPLAFLREMGIQNGMGYGEAKRAAFDSVANTAGVVGTTEPSTGPRHGSFCPSIKARFKQRKPERNRS